MKVSSPKTKKMTVQILKTNKHEGLEPENKENEGTEPNITGLSVVA